MVSYRTSLMKIGFTKSDFVSYMGFASRPQSLRQAIRSMDAPTSKQWKQVSDIFRDDGWTDEVQGVAWDGANWIFSTNANQKKPGVYDKSIYVFKGGTSLGDNRWISRVRFKNVPHPIGGTKESDDHWGQVTFFDGFVYVAHFWAGGQKDTASAVEFKDTNGKLSFTRWIELEKPTGQDGRHERAEFQAINPWDRKIYTCFGGGSISEFFIHDLDTGAWTGRSLKLNPPVKKVQGACFSPNGHLYIASNTKLPGNSDYQTIWYHAALNGHQFGVIKVMALESKQELEGNCFGAVGFKNGKSAQIHAVLLENEPIALDDIYFKSFSCSVPDIV
jgi:hypothetical protein